MEKPTYVEEDARLEAAAESSTMELAKHRWHWTKDGANPHAVTVSQYARDVARARRTIQTGIDAYQMWLDAGRAAHPFSYYMERSRLGADTHAAAEAVAEVTGSSVGTVRTHNRDEMKAVREQARERAERRGTSMEEEVHHVAERREMSRKAAARQAEEKRKAHSVRYLMVEGAISKAVKELREAMAEATGVEFTDEERELLEDSIARLRGMLALIEVELTGGQSVVDWDAELAKLTE